MSFFNDAQNGTGSWHTNRSVSCPFFSGYERDEAFPQDTDLSPVPPDPQKQKQPTVKTMGYFFCGAGGDRTLVQTGNQYAFYMFISDFIVGQQQDLNHQLLPYPLKLHHGHEAFLMTIPDIPTPLYQTPRNKSF